MMWTTPIKIPVTDLNLLSMTGSRNGIKKQSFTNDEATPVTVTEVGDLHREVRADRVARKKAKEDQDRTPERPNAGWSKLRLT